MPNHSYSGTYLRIADGLDYQYELILEGCNIRGHVSCKGIPLATVMKIPVVVADDATTDKEREQIAREWICQHIESGEIFDKRYLESIPKSP